MDSKLFKLEIVAPDRIIFQGEVRSFSAPGTLGAFQVLYNHAPLISSLVIGEMKYTDANGNTRHFATSGGFVEVRNNRVLALVDAAEPANQIDRERAEAAKSRAIERLKQRKPEIDVERAQLSLYRALNRLKVSSRVHESVAE